MKMNTAGGLINTDAQSRAQDKFRKKNEFRRRTQKKSQTQKKMLFNGRCFLVKHAFLSESERCFFSCFAWKYFLFNLLFVRCCCYASKLTAFAKCLIQFKRIRFLFQLDQLIAQFQTIAHFSIHIKSKNWCKLAAHLWFLILRQFFIF